MTWEQALSYALSPVGAGVIAGVVLSYLAQYVPWYELLEPRHKRLVFLAVCLAVPLLAAIASVVTGLCPLTWDPLIWGALQAGGMAFAAGTVAHTKQMPTRYEDAAYQSWKRRFYAED